MTAPTTYRARLTPLSGETCWTLDDGALTEQRGKRTARYPLAGLTGITLNPAQARRPHASLALRFGWRRVSIPSAGFGPRGVEAHPATFSAFARALAAQAQDQAPGARFAVARGTDLRSPLVWAIVLLAAGAAAMLLTSLGSVAGGLGLSLAARLAFVALLLGCVLPWLEAADPRLDPLAIPDSLLPR